MTRKLRRVLDHQDLNNDWGRCTKHVRRAHTSEYVRDNWNHLLVIHPGNSLAEAGEYASQPSPVPANRSDIKRLPQGVSANWKRTHPEKGKPTTIKLDECVITVASGGFTEGWSVIMSFMAADVAER